MQLEGQSGDGPMRFDFAQIGKVEVMSTGALKIPAVLGRVGVLNYNRGGKTVRELRPPDEVFRADSMKTFASAAVTDLHPPREKAWITPENWKEHAVGYVDSDVRRDGDLLRGSVIVQDASMISKIQGGERSELSPGYMPLNLDATPGRYNAATGEYGPDVTVGVEYDVVQRDIFYNSTGIGPRGWGRQGSTVALRLDSVHEDGLSMHGTPLGDFLISKMKQMGISLVDLAQETGILDPKDPEGKPLLRHGPSSKRTHVLESILDGWTDRPSDVQLRALGKALDTPFDDLINFIPDDLQRLDGGDRPNPQEKSTTMETSDIRLDGLTASSVPKQAADIINKAIADRDSQIKELTEAASANEARFDGATEQLATAKKQLDELPGQLRGQIEQRSKLEGQALTVLGADVKLDGKKSREVQELVIQAVAKSGGADELKLDGKDDAYVDARFDFAMEGFKAPDASAKAIQAIAGGKHPAAAVRQDAGDAPDPEAARTEMIERQAAASKPKLAAV